MTASGFRLQHFKDALERSGHEVETVAFWPTDEPESTQEHVRRVVADRAVDESLVRRICQQVKPDVVVLAGSYPALFVLRHLPSEVPVWVDLPGDLMAESQVRERTEGQSYYARHHLRAALSALLRADKLSAVSKRQRHAMIGQLGLCGRLSGQTTGHEFVEVITVAFPNVLPVSPEPRSGDSVRVSLMGSFNHWTDVDLLIGTMAKMRDEDVTWVLNGGVLGDFNRVAYSRFLQRLEGLDLVRRIEPHGYVSFKDLPGVLATCHLGLNLDLQCYETELGSRNRILFGLAAGLPQISTVGAEIVDELAKRGVLQVINVRDPSHVVKAMDEVMARLEGWRRVIADERDDLAIAYDPFILGEPLTRWAATPTRAPDQPGTERLSWLRRLLDLQESVNTVVGRLAEGIQKIKRVLR